MSYEQEKKIQTIVEELVRRMGFQAEIVVKTTNEAEMGFYCSVSVPEGQNFLIGQYGMNLAALQHLTRILVRKELGEKMNIIVDVNNYFSEKKELLEKEATQAMEEALQGNKAVTLRPMLPYERKIIHAFFAESDSIITESTGMGEDRRVVVRPKSKMED